MKSVFATSLILALLVAPSHGAVLAEHAAVSSPERLATMTGLRILRQEGNAADAAVAVAFMLSVLRPEAAGIGGGGTALYFNAPTGDVWALDFRPELPNPAYLEGAVLDNALSLGVPGFVAGFEELHRKFGSRPWSSLLQTAIASSKEGSDSAAVIGLVEQELLVREIERPPFLEREDRANQPLAAILSRVAERGADEIHLGQTAKRIVARSRELGGLLSPRALAEYAPKWRSPIRIDFQGDQVYTFVSPAGAGSVLAEMIAVLSGFEWNGRSAHDPETIHLFSEAERFGWNQVRTMISERGTVARPKTASIERLDEVRRMIEGAPSDQTIVSSTTDRHTSLGFVVVDDDGSTAVVSLSLGPPFGAGKLLDGAAFFSESSARENSSPALPLLVIHDDRARLGIVSSGSGREAFVGGGIYIRNKLIGTDLESLVALPRFIPALEARTLVCEKGTDLKMINALNTLGQGVKWSGDLGLVHAIETTRSIVVISDPRGGTAGGY